MTFVYAEVLDDSSVPPVDPLDPEVEVDPENKPDLPENQGLLSIDFVSQYNLEYKQFQLMIKLIMHNHNDY